MSWVQSPSPAPVRRPPTRGPSSADTRALGAIRSAPDRPPGEPPRSLRGHYRGRGPEAPDERQEDLGPGGWACRESSCWPPECRQLLIIPAHTPMILQVVWNCTPLSRIHEMIKNIGFLFFLIMLSACADPSKAPIYEKYKSKITGSHVLTASDIPTNFEPDQHQDNAIVSISIFTFKHPSKEIDIYLFASFIGNYKLNIIDGYSLEMIIDNESRIFKSTKYSEPTHHTSSRIAVESGTWSISQKEIDDIATCKSLKIRIIGEKFAIQRTIDEKYRKKFAILSRKINEL